jgi:hypothetical protein
VSHVDHAGTDSRKPSLAQMERRDEEIKAEIAKTKAILAGFEAREANAKAALAKAVAALAENRKEFAAAHEAAYQAHERLTCVKRPDWCPEPPSNSVAMQVVGALFTNAVGVPKYHVKTEVSTAEMQAASQAGVGYLEARDRYMGARVSIALSRVNEEAARFGGAAMELSGGLQNLGATSRNIGKLSTGSGGPPRGSGGGGGGRVPPSGGGEPPERPSGGGGKRPPTGGAGGEGMPLTPVLIREVEKTGLLRRASLTMRKLGGFLQEVFGIMKEARDLRRRAPKLLPPGEGGAGRGGGPRKQ